ncbi:hypothetical protein HZS_3537 [Henneguya salminicola]|nr:hypothetical protein HZS_3537 [Henneguya salminicola]
MNNTISIQLGAQSNLVYTNLNKIQSKNCNPNNSVKSIFIDYKKQFKTKTLDKIYNLVETAQNEIQVDPLITETPDNIDLDWADDIYFTENDKILALPDPISNKNNISPLYDSIDFIDSHQFTELIEEEIRKFSENLDILNGFHIFTETFRSVSFAEPIILNHLNDEFNTKYKIIYGLWDCDPSNSVTHSNQLFINSLLTIETLSHPNTLYIPISHHKNIGKRSSNEIIKFNTWDECGYSFDLNDVHQRSHLFAGLIDSFLQSTVNNIDMRDIVATMSSCWGSGGSMSGLSFAPFTPLSPGTHIFQQLNQGTDISGFADLCVFSPGFTHPQPSAGEISFQNVSLNNHPDIDNSLIPHDIARYLWADKLSAQFNPNTFTKKNIPYVSRYLE